MSAVLILLFRIGYFIVGDVILFSVCDVILIKQSNWNYWFSDTRTILQHCGL